MAPPLVGNAIVRSVPVNVLRPPEVMLSLALVPPAKGPVERTREAPEVRVAWRTPTLSRAAPLGSLN